MTTLQFFNDNSTGCIDQSTWEEDILINEYDCNKNVNNDEFNDFGINSMFEKKECEHELFKYDQVSFSTVVDCLELDTIDEISLKIKVPNEIYKMLFSFYFITIILKTKSDFIKLVDSSLLDVCFISYLNNHTIEQDESIITIPLIQFNHLEHGYIYKLVKRKNIYISFRNFTNSGFNLVEKQLIDNIKVVFTGKKYYDFNLTNINSTKYYKQLDMNWYNAEYKNTGVYIHQISTKYQYITFSLLKKFNNKDKTSTDDINEYINNQPEIEDVIFQYENLVPWVYDLTYMKKIVLFGINIYILPLYPEFVNTNNIKYYMKNSNNGINEYINSYKIIIKINSLESYNLHLTFFGEWID